MADVVLVVDNLSPFTTDILDCLRKVDFNYKYKKFSEVTEADIRSCDRVILSGRRKNSKEINAANSFIIRQCYYENSKPVLGICYGAEIIALTLGGSIHKMPIPLKEILQVSITKSNPLTADKKSITVYESHGYCIANLPANFMTLASSQYCKHEIFASKNGNNIYGTQFHPEKSGKDGLNILVNFLKI